MYNDANDTGVSLAGPPERHHHSAEPREILASAWRNRELIAQMAQRDVIGRYRGSVLGIVWSFFNPVLMLTVYTFVFSVVFKARWNVEAGSKTEFAIVLFVGLIVFGLFSECLNRAPGMVLSNPNYVKRVVFPLEVLPWVGVSAALFHAAVSMVVLLIFCFMAGQPLPWTLILFPLVLLPLLLLSLGLGWLLSSLGVFLRDVGHVISVLSTVLMFASPVFYPISALPDGYQHLMLLNPLAIILEQARNVVLWGILPDFLALTGVTLLSTLVACLGFAWFQKTRSRFADVI